MPRRFAVIIGVNDYDTYDQAHGLPRGTSTLRAPVNDAIAWFQLLRRMGYRQQDILVLTTPTVVDAQLQAYGARCAEATRAEVVAAREWLFHHLEQAEGPAAGMFVFSGHGSFLGSNGGQLFPSDYDGTLEHTILLENWADRIAALGGRVSLTAFVDACRGGDGLGTRMPAKPWHPTRHLFVTGCSPGQITQERCIHGQWRSVFSWTVETLMGQWRTGIDSHGEPYVMISYTDLVDRAGQLIAAISGADPAVPMLYGAPHDQLLPVGQPPGSGGGITVSDPNAPAPGHEIPAWTTGSMTGAGVYAENGEVGIVWSDKIAFATATWAFPPTTTSGPIATTPFAGVSDFTLDLTANAANLDPATRVQPNATATSDAWPLFASASYPLSATSDTPPSTAPNGSSMFVTSSGDELIIVTDTAAADGTFTLTAWRNSTQNPPLYLTDQGAYATSNTVSTATSNWKRAIDTLVPAFGGLGADTWQTLTLPTSGSFTMVLGQNTSSSSPVPQDAPSGIGFQVGSVLTSAGDLTTTKTLGIHPAQSKYFDAIHGKTQWIDGDPANGAYISKLRLERSDGETRATSANTGGTNFYIQAPAGYRIATLVVRASSTDSVMYAIGATFDAIP